MDKPIDATSTEIKNEPRNVFSKVFHYIKLYLKAEFDWKFFVFTLLFMSVGMFWFYNHDFVRQLKWSQNLSETLSKQVGTYLFLATVIFFIFATITSLKKRMREGVEKRSLNLQRIAAIGTIVLLGVGAYLVYQSGGLFQYRYEHRGDYDLTYYFGGLYLGVFVIAYLAYAAITGKTDFLTNGKFWFLVFLGVLVFTIRSVTHVPMWKIQSSFSHLTYPDYWFRLSNMVLRMVATMLPLAFYWFVMDRKDRPLYGFTFKGYDTKPYLTMLALMLPLIAIASFLPDFQMSYPRAGKYGLQYFDLANTAHIKYFALFELIYGMDFITIEFFFRGFLIYAFMRIVGPGAILTMACFYCFIHFGKPLGETISSYWGGTLLGILAYYSGSIIGGIIVHMGIAWLMEFGAVLGKLYNN